MSRKKKKDSGPMPAASAGLLRFFEEETEGVKIRPELLVVFAVSLMVLSVLAKVFFCRLNAYFTVSVQWRVKLLFFEPNLNEEIARFFLLDLQLVEWAVQ